MPRLARKQLENRALTVVRENKKLENIGVGLIAPVSRMLVSNVVRSTRSGVMNIKPAMDKFQAILLAAMVSSHLTGRERVIRWARAEHKGFATAYDDATNFLQWRQDLSEEDIKELTDAYGDQALKVTRGLSNQLETAAQKSIQKTVQEGKHIKEGVADLRKAFETSGVSSTNPFLLETLVRTQVSLAYNAGRWKASQSPAIQEILWGYGYYTVGDARVRDTHAAMDNTVLPKDDFFWTENWPPNGYNCRCTTVMIFDEEEEKQPDQNMVVDGKKVVPGTDKGWKFNPGKLVKETLPVKVPIPISKIPKKVVAKVAPKPKAVKPVKVTPKKVEPVLTQEQWIKRLPSDEVMEMKRYSSHLGPVIVKTQREFLKGLKFADELSDVEKGYLRIAQSVEKTIASSPPIQETMYRGMKFSSTIKGDKLNYATFDKSVKQGTLKFNNLTSFTTDEIRALEFTTPKGSPDFNRVLIKVKGGTKHGVKISSISEYPTEQEVILSSKVKYRVINDKIEPATKLTAKTRIIDLEEVIK